MPSEEKAQNRRTYNLEDLSNTLEAAAVGGVPIVDTLQKIADPSALPDQSEDEIFETSQSEICETPKPQLKKKPPPKPKRTFSNSSKPEVKFVSDSFVIEYYTSPPKRSQSDSVVPVGKPNTQEEYEMKTQEESSVKSHQTVKNKENLYINQSTVQNTIDGKSVSPSNQSQPVESVNEGKPHSPRFKKFESQKPTTEVVSNLDTLLLKLAAEVEKPTHVLPSNNGTRVESSSTADVVPGTKTEISNTKTDICNTKPDYLSTKLAISNTKTDFSNSKSDVLSTKFENLSMKLEVSSTKTGFSDTDLKKSSTETGITSTNPDVSTTNSGPTGTKSDDEGYCSLSRKPGTRLLKTEHEIQQSSEDLFKKEKLITGSEKGHAEENSQVEIIRSFDSNGRESQEGVIELTDENDTENKDPDSGEVTEKMPFHKGFVFYGI